MSYRNAGAVESLDLAANLRDVDIDQLPVPLGQTYAYSLRVDCQG